MPSRRLFSDSDIIVYLYPYFGSVSFLREKVLECPIYCDTFYGLGVRRNKTYSKPWRIIAKYFIQAKGPFINVNGINPVTENNG